MFGLARVKAAFTMQYAGRNVYLAHKQTMTAVELRFTDAEALGLWIHWPTFSKQQDHCASTGIHWI